MNNNRNFLKLLNNNLNIIEPTYFKGGLWLKYFSCLNSLYMRALRAIVNHAPIGEYCLRFFPQKDFAYSCELDLIETRRLSGAVHTRVEVYRINLEMSGLIERPWLQLICCAICLPRGCNFR